MKTFENYKKYLSKSETKKETDRLINDYKGLLKNY